MTREDPVAEFVRHYCQMVEATGNEPSRLSSAFDEHPNLGASIKRLGEIYLAVDRHRRTARRRYFGSTHSQFRAMLNDFGERWKDPYNEIRDVMYVQALAQISKEFVRNYRILIEQTGNDPNMVEQARERDPELLLRIDGLQEIRATVDQRGPEFGPFLSQAPDEFHRALEDFKNRWVGALAALVVPRILDLESV